MKSVPTFPLSFLLIIDEWLVRMGGRGSTSLINTLEPDLFFDSGYYAPKSYVTCPILCCPYIVCCQICFNNILVVDYMTLILSTTQIWIKYFEVQHFIDIVIAMDSIAYCIICIFHSAGKTSSKWFCSIVLYFFFFGILQSTLSSL